MNHLTEEQLVEHYFAEGVSRVMVETHLRICSRCEQAYEEISNVLAVRAPEPPARQPQYGKRVWQSIEGELNPYAVIPRSYWSLPRLIFASCCLLALSAAFSIGALWQRSRIHPAQASISPGARERVVLLILDEHLDRSERLLVQINHAGSEPEAVEASLQSEARQMLPDNRLYRQAISTGQDPIMVATLDHLERVLLEIANSPDKLDGADLARIEREMNTDSLLFQIRVLRARTSTKGSHVKSSGNGASI
jgi:hypothetical protein